MQNADSIVKSIWSVPEKPLAKGAWLWWFWLFFIHDENTGKTGKCRQIMILWSVKNDPGISCNGLQIKAGQCIEGNGGKFTLDGAAAAWYFDGEKMREDFVLEASKMRLDSSKLSLDAPGATPSSFCHGAAGEFVTSINAGGIHFDLHAKKTDGHPAVGPTYGRTKLFGPMEIEGTRLEILGLSGHEMGKYGRKAIHGTAYFQKILLAAPPPQWYWGLYHFPDGSFATYMQAYAGRAALSHNLTGEPLLKKPTASIKEDILIYHAPSGRVFEGNKLSVVPKKSEIPGCYSHKFAASGKNFEADGECEGYAHACWTFVKNIGALPIRSRFKYNEYPAVMKRLEVRPERGKKIALENGWGSMENSWGFMI